jgi:L-lactate dehydrogenase
MDTVTDACRASRPASPGHTVRTPGQRGVELAAQQESDGVALYPTIMPALQQWALKLGVTVPMAL